MIRYSHEEGGESLNSRARSSRDVRHVLSMYMLGTTHDSFKTHRYDRMDLVSSVLSQEQEKIERIFERYANSEKEMTSRCFVRLAKACGVARHVATVMWAKATATASNVRKIRLNRDDFTNILLPDFCLQVRHVEVSVLLERMLVEKVEKEEKESRRGRVNIVPEEPEEKKDELSSLMRTSSLVESSFLERRRGIVVSEKKKEEEKKKKEIVDDELSSFMQTSSWGRTSSSSSVVTRKDDEKRRSRFPRRMVKRKKKKKKEKVRGGLAVAGAMCIRPL